MKHAKLLLVLLVCAMFLFQWQGQLLAQETRGAIVGRITDPSGAVIAGANVTVSNPATGMKQALTTNAEGLYRAPLLPPGIYTVEVTASGFKKAVRPNVEVRIADRLDISFAMELGTSEQQVTVTSEVPLMNTESASLGTVVDSKRVAALPVSYGNPFLLIGLTAGVTFNGSTRLDRPFEPTHIVNFSMGGTRGNLNDITIDGAPATATANAFEVTASYVPLTDVVQEFKVQTNTFDAAFGQTQGGVTNISIKSGTNSLHGSAGYSFQRASFWATDFFSNKSGATKPEFKFDRWSGSISGPVYIPKVYNGKNKTFFLFGHEGVHDSRPRHDDATNHVPTPAERAGDFSSLLANGGATYGIYDPTTRVATSDGHYMATMFPGNKIPSSRFNAVGLKILSFYPATELTPGDALGLQNYKDASTTERTKYYNQTYRGDQNIGDKQRFFVRYSAYVRNSTYNEYFKNAFVGDQFAFKSKNAAFDHIYTISPTLLLNTRYSYNRFIRYGDQPVGAVGYDLSQLGFASNYVSAIPKSEARIPRINLNGYIGNGHTNEARPVNNHTVAATLTKSAGAHSLRGGFEFRIYQETDRFASNQQSGQFTFGSNWVKGPREDATASSSNVGQSVAELLLGLPDSGNIVRQSSYVEQSGSWGFFVQDDWKVTPKLTLNLGVRYEFETALKERFNRSTLGFDGAYVQPLSAAVQAKYATIFPSISGGFAELPVSALTSVGGMTFPKVGGTGSPLYNTPKNIVMPRLGVAYRVDNKTTLRTGFGMFAGFLGERRGDVYQNGFTQNTNMSITTDNLNFPYQMANPFPNGITEPVGAAGGYQTFLGQGFTSFNQNPQVPITMRWELSLQREFRGFLAQLDYIGNKTNHIEITRNLNTTPAQYLSKMVTRDNATNSYLTANIANPYYQMADIKQNLFTNSKISRQVLLSPYRIFNSNSGVNAINTQENTGYSWYHSMQLTLSKRFSKGYTVQGSYTLQKWQQAVNLLNASDLRPIEEISDADAPHRFNISSVWSLPFGKGRALMSGAGPVMSRIVGGWEISGIWTLQSGFPIAFTQGGNNYLFYGGNPVLPLSERSPEHWFNTAAFETSSSLQPYSGTQLRVFPFRFSQLRGPRINNVDISINKQTRIGEGKNLEFRAEALNFANHPLFPGPNVNPTSPNTLLQKSPNDKDTGFGQISASTMNNYARRLQMTLRFTF